MILTDQEILDNMEKGLIKVEPFTRECVPSMPNATAQELDSAQSLGLPIGCEAPRGPRCILQDEHERAANAGPCADEFHGQTASYEDAWITGALN